MQKPNVQAEVYNNNKKCDWEKKKQTKLKSLIRFHSANKKTTTMEGGCGCGMGKKNFFNPKESTEQVKTEEE